MRGADSEIRQDGQIVEPRLVPDVQTVQSERVGLPGDDIADDGRRGGVAGVRDDGLDFPVVYSSGIAEIRDGRADGLLEYFLASVDFLFRLIPEESREIRMRERMGAEIHAGGRHLRHFVPREETGFVHVVRDDIECRPEAVFFQKGEDRGVGILIAVVECQDEGFPGEFHRISEIVQADRPKPVRCEPVYLGLETFRGDVDGRVSVVLIFAYVVVHQDGYRRRYGNLLGCRLGTEIRRYLGERLDPGLLKGGMEPVEDERDARQGNENGNDEKCFFHIIPSIIYTHMDDNGHPIFFPDVRPCFPRYRRMLYAEPV